MEKTIKVGSRKSQLALIQTEHVVNQLKTLHPEKRFEIVTMATIGDKILDTALSKIGEKSLFTKELEKALEDKTVDLVVHSLKDLPTTLPPGMTIAAVCEREDPRDAVIMKPENQDKTLSCLSENSVIGTSSLRRAAQLKRVYPHLKFESVRGNLNTRLRKLDEGKEVEYAALILAAAGVIRMDWRKRITQYLTPEECMYAVGQGALAVECRSDDTSTIVMLNSLHHQSTVLCTIAERALLKTLEGGCSVPVAVHSSLDSSSLVLRCGVFNLDGTKSLMKTLTRTVLPEQEKRGEKRAVDGGEKNGGEGHSSDEVKNGTGTEAHVGITATNIDGGAQERARLAGEELATELLKEGAQEILAEAREQNKQL